jgi:hypothetical protein
MNTCDWMLNFALYSQFASGLGRIIQHSLDSWFAVEQEIVDGLAQIKWATGWS